ncbi:membrane hypothetical protein [Gammaproteobacteria bacterium]
MKIMEFFETFLLAFWPAFLGSQVGWSIAWLAIRSKSDLVLPFLGPKSFRELSNFSDDEQKRLLDETVKEAFGCWKWLMEFFIFPLTFSVSGVFGSTFLKVAFPGTPSWVSSCGAGMLVGLSFWIVVNFEIRYIKPLLENRINNILNKT